MSDKENTHRSYYNDLGDEVPSVTTVIKLLSKDKIIPWANWLGKMGKDYETVLAEKAEYGTAVHNLSEMYFSGLLDKRYVPKGIDLPLSEYKKYINKFSELKQLFDNYNLEIINQELVLEGSEFGGTIDLLLKHKTSNKIFLLDFKTSKQIYRSMFIQLAAYTHLLKEVKDLDVTHVGIILITKSVKNENFLTLVNTEANEVNYEIFKNLLNIYKLTGGNI